MSKAFTDEEAGEDAPIVTPRAPLPPGVPNYVTARGLALLREELAALHAERARAESLANERERGRTLGALSQRRSALEQRIATAEIVMLGSDSQVRFGATIRVSATDGEHQYQIVGVDEADPARGKLAFTSPLARALLGHAPGDTVTLRTPRGREDVEIVAVTYGE